MTGTLPPLLDSVVGGGTPGRSCSRAYGSNAAVPGRGVISEPDLLCTSEAEILDGFSDQGVTQLLQPLLSVPQPNASPSIPSVSTSSSITQANLLPSTSSIKPTTKIESRLPEPISASVAAPDDSLNTSASYLSIKTCAVPTTSNEFATLSTEVQPSLP
ncbi:uncharacterized protein TNCV_2207191 [Trichonephila clavipes]|uniref:Uncharacterized protein n=1 Tax=Trichonephila clavipes TaxID=2585209 RepID=A0A8X6VET3_TRICX|nr:uncharacterized protein TNCV_2207191 [Trichonephila clavipes]